jgi:hypothetical protein
MARSIDDPRNRFRFPTPVIWVVACFCLQVIFPGNGNAMDADLSRWIWLGSMWAGWAGCLWLSGAVPQIPVRWLLIVSIGLWHTWWMSIQQSQPMLRYAITLGGFGVAQTLLFRFFRVPGWSLETLRVRAREGVKRQFSIFDLLLLTTSAALLITAIKRYEPTDLQLQWSGLGVVYLSLSLISAFAVLAVLSPLRVWFAVFLIPLITGGSLCLAWLESPGSNSGPPMINWWPYYAIQGTFAMQMVCLAICGQPDRNPDIDETDEPEEDVKTQAPTNSIDDESPTSEDLLPFRPSPHR